MGRIISLVLVGVVCISAQPSLERAVSLARERRYSEARQALAGAAEPAGLKQRIAFHRLKAAIASGLGEAAAAAKEMRAGLELAPGDVGLLMATAIAESQASLLEDALGHAQLVGDSAPALELVGDIQEKRGEYVAAVKAYQKAVALAPDREAYRIALALELVRHDTFLPAIAVLEQALPLFPRSARMRTLLGIAQYAADNTQGAISSLTEAIALEPKLEPAYQYLAKILLESSAAPPQRAIDALCDWDTTVCGALKLRMARDRNDKTAAEEAIALLKRTQASSAVAHCELGRAYEWASRPKEARTEMEACVALDPSPVNHYRLGLIYGRLGLTDLARQQMEARTEGLKNLNEQAARRMKAVQAFEYSIK